MLHVLLYLFPSHGEGSRAENLDTERGTWLLGSRQPTRLHHMLRSTTVVAETIASKSDQKLNGPSGRDHRRSRQNRHRMRPRRVQVYIVLINSPRRTRSIRHEFLKKHIWYYFLYIGFASNIWATILPLPPTTNTLDGNKYRATTKRTSSDGKTASSTIETVADTDSADVVALQLTYGDAREAGGGTNERAIVTAEGAIL